MHYGSDYFGNYTCLVQAEGLYFASNSIAYYKDYAMAEIEENFYMFDNKQEAFFYFDSIVKIADKYEEKTITCF